MWLLSVGYFYVCRLFTFLFTVIRTETVTNGQGEKYVYCEGLAERIYVLDVIYKSRDCSVSAKTSSYPPPDVDTVMKFCLRERDVSPYNLLSRSYVFCKAGIPKLFSPAGRIAHVLTFRGPDAMSRVSAMDGVVE